MFEGLLKETRHALPIVVSKNMHTVCACVH